MNNNFKYALKLCLAALLALVTQAGINQTALAALEPVSTEAKTFRPTDEQEDTAKDIVKLLQKHHYLNIEIDNNFSESFLDTYLDLLDPGKSHLLSKDVRGFSRSKHKLDDEIRKGRLDTLFNIYNIYHQRRITRLDYTLKILEQGIDKINFDKDESIELDRKEAPWPTSHKEIEKLWQKLLKNDILNLRLNDKKAEEINKTLTKRYSNQLRMLQQTNKNDVFEYVMTAFTHQYDPHTDYFPPQQSENFNIHMRLSLEGIGALLQREEEYIKVVRLIPAGPADRGKLLQPADRIIGVGQGKKGEIVDVEGWRLDDVVELIRGKKGTVVRLNVIPASSTDVTNTKIIAITRDTVKLEEQSAQKEIIEIKRGDTTHKIGVIELPTFYIDFRAAMSGDPNYRSSTRDVEKLIRELQQEDISGLIIDLRNNGGGSLQEANDLTGLFIPTGPIVQIRGAGNHIEPYSDVNPKLVYGGPLAVMVNRLSASASEIFAGAIQDYERGIIIGSRTFGKGTVQTINPMNAGQLKYTQAKYYRINGDSTQERGIIPDIHFPAILDSSEIGESTLPQAMPWDQIQPARYRKLANLESIIVHLDKLHKQRTASDPDFLYLRDRLAFLEESRSKNQASLKESVRRQERKDAEQRLLQMENQRRVGKGLEPLKAYSELEKLEENEDSDKPSDGLVQEVGNILIDWLNLQNPQSQKQIAAH